MKVTILGAGKVGRTFARGLRASDHAVTLRAGRRKRGTGPMEGDLVVIAVRDPEIAKTAEALASSRAVGKGTSVIHVAGSIGPGALDPLRPFCAGVAQAHPLVSFASESTPPDLTGALMWIRGDAAAVRRARSLSRALGMVPRVWPHVDEVLYHAAAALLSNGGAALAGSAAQVMQQAGVPAKDVARALGVLLRSVAWNVEHLGLPAALTGPVRRGDQAAIFAHLGAIQDALPELVPLYAACVRAQVPMAAELGDASRAALREIESMVDSAHVSTRRARRHRHGRRTGRGSRRSA